MVISALIWAGLKGFLWPEMGAQSTGFLLLLEEEQVACGSAPAQVRVPGALGRRGALFGGEADRPSVFVKSTVSAPGVGIP